MTICCFVGKTNIVCVTNLKDCKIEINYLKFLTLHYLRSRCVCLVIFMHHLLPTSFSSILFSLLFHFLLLLKMCSVYILCIARFGTDSVERFIMQIGVQFENIYSTFHFFSVLALYTELENFLSRYLDSSKSQFVTQSIMNFKKSNFININQSKICQIINSGFTFKHHWLIVHIFRTVLEKYYV
jgi:hypothetical protein